MQDVQYFADFKIGGQGIAAIFAPWLKHEWHHGRHPRAGKSEGSTLGN